MLKLRPVNQLRLAYLRGLSGQPLAQTQRDDGADEEYTAQPAYPEIRDLNFKARKQRTAADWHEEIRQVPTVEEKLIKINMPRYYGYKVVDFNDTKIPYNALPITQHYTRTVLEKTSPVAQQEGAKTEEKDGADDALFKAAREDVIEALEFAHDYSR